MSRPSSQRGRGIRRFALWPLAAAALLVPAIGAAPATAGVEEIVVDCYDDGILDGSYAAPEIRDARNNLPADIDEYSDCRDVLGAALGGTGSKAIAAAPGTRRSAASDSGGPPAPAGREPLTPADPAEQRALDAALARPYVPVRLGRSDGWPGVTGAGSNRLPDSVFALLVLLGMTVSGAAAFGVRRALGALLRRRHAA